MVEKGDRTHPTKLLEQKRDECLYRPGDVVMCGNDPHDIIVIVKSIKRMPTSQVDGVSKSYYSIWRGKYCKIYDLFLLADKRLGRSTVVWSSDDEET